MSRTLAGETAMSLALAAALLIAGSLVGAAVRSDTTAPETREAVSVANPVRSSSPTTTVVKATTIAPTTLAPTTTIPPPAPIEPHVVAAFAPAIDALTADPLADRLDITASVWVDGYGEVGSINPDFELFPASNQKLFTAVGALELLESEHRFTTRVLTDTSGILYLQAGGDPTLTAADLARLAADVAAITTRATDLIIDASRFESATMAPGWQDWHIPTYVGPMSAFTVDDNRWTKDPAFVAAPALENGRRFARQLAQAGVRIDGEVLEGQTPTDAIELAARESATRDDLLRSMLLSSDNQIADALVREIGYVRGNVGSTPAGTEQIRDAIAELGLGLAGDDGDGSGLSRVNLRSAREWQGLLVVARAQSWFDQFYNSLPVAGRTGTLASRLTGSVTNGNVRAKTGTIIGGRSLSGYLALASGHEAVFSIVVNGENSNFAQGLIDTFVRALAAVRLPSQVRIERSPSS